MPLTFDKPVVVQLRDAECLTLDAVWLNVLHGRVWVTRAGDPDDHFIDAPRAVRLEAGCRGLVSAEGPAQIADIGWLGIQLALANGGSCFLPARMAAPFIAAGRLYRVAGSPEYVLPAYVVYPRTTDSPVLEQARQGLRELAGLERERAARG